MLGNVCLKMVMITLRDLIETPLYKYLNSLSMEKFIYFAYGFRWVYIRFIFNFLHTFEFKHNLPTHHTHVQVVYVISLKINLMYTHE
jgi:hypothetical protein